jgi:hypothetical protein
MLLCIQFNLIAQKRDAFLNASFQYSNQQQVGSLSVGKEIFPLNSKKWGLLFCVQANMFHKPVSNLNVRFPENFTISGNNATYMGSIDLMAGIQVHIHKWSVMAGINLIGISSKPAVTGTLTLDLDSFTYSEKITGSVDNVYNKLGQSYRGISIVRWVIQYRISPHYQLQSGITFYHFNYLFSYYNPYHKTQGTMFGEESFNIASVGVSYLF